MRSLLRSRARVLRPCRSREQSHHSRRRCRALPWQSCVGSGCRTDQGSQTGGRCRRGCSPKDGDSRNVTGDQVVNRLKAWAAGKPLPRGSTRHVYVAGDPDLLIVAFVRMGGESAPWGIAYVHPGTNPTIMPVPEGRNPTLVADMSTALAPALLRHFLDPDNF